MKTKKPLSDRTKWIVCIALAVVAILTVILCAAGGAFHFEYKAVTANDTEPTPTPTAKTAEEEPGATYYTVFVSAGNGGKVNPTGSVRVKAWDNLTVSFAPNEGYRLQSVTVDGAEVGTKDSYILRYITADHSIVAAFEPIPTENTHNTVS